LPLCFRKLMAAVTRRSKVNMPPQTTAERPSISAYAMSRIRVNIFSHGLQRAIGRLGAR